MKFGKLADISNVDFKLPDEPIWNQSILPGTTSKKGTIYIGCTGWSMPEWKGTYYPAKLAAKDFLKHYSQQFNTIEFNTTHYNIPKVDNVIRWKEESTDDFIFCPKVFKFISHTKQLGLDSVHITRMIDSLSHLEEKLGPFFMQLPPYFGTESLDLLESFLKSWPSGIPIFFELRNPSWYIDDDSLEKISHLLLRYDQSLLITDVAGRRDIMHMRLYNTSLMVRWGGNGLHQTDYERIDDWVARIIHYINHGVEKVYFFTHEPDNILAPDIAAYLYGKFENINFVNSRGPKRISEDSQLQLF